MGRGRLLSYVLDRHAASIPKHFPGFEADEMGGADPSRSHFSVSEPIAGIHDSSRLVEA
jgi:hypothetical protein